MVLDRRNVYEAGRSKKRSFVEEDSIILDVKLPLRIISGTVYQFNKNDQSHTKSRE